jgi:uncharacterized repeat protein (TIGR02543 family)
MHQDSPEKNIETPAPAPEETGTPKPRGKWFGRGIYGSKDVPIRALDTFILCLVAGILLFTVIGAVNGGFRVNFDTGVSDLQITTQRVRYGEYATEPETPVRPGYTLTGWSTDSQEVKPWNFTYSTVQNDMTLYAVWAPAQYTVCFDLDGGTVNGNDAAKDQTVTFGQPYGALPAPEKENCTFGGWACNGQIITADTAVTLTSDHILTAVWQQG